MTELRSSGTRRTSAVTFSQGERPKVATMELPAPRAGESLIAIETAAINHLDASLAAAALDIPSGARTGGTEGVGRVVQSDSWPQGTRVHVTGAGVGVSRDGLWAAEAVVPDDALVPIPDAGDGAVLATHVIAALSACAALFDVGRLQPGEHVAVTGAKRGVGAMAVALAERLPGTVVTPLTGAGDEVPRVDLLVDMLGGEGLARLLQHAVKPGGRAVLVGYLAGEDVVLNLPLLFQSDVALLPLDLMRRGPGLVTARQELAEQIAHGQLPIEPVQRIALAEIPELLPRLRACKSRVAVDPHL